MKLINTYKQRYITWFNYKHLFKLKTKLYVYKSYPESELITWLENPHLNINIRKPYEAD